MLGRVVRRREEAAAAAGGSPRRAPAAHDGALSADERAAVALSYVLALAPHTAPLVLRFFAAAPPPLARFASADAALQQPDAAGCDAARALARAALRLADAAAACGDAPLQRAVGASSCCASALRLARHADVHVRFAVARLAAAGLALAAAHTDALRRQCMTHEEVRALAPERLAPHSHVTFVCSVLCGRERVADDVCLCARRSCTLSWPGPTTKQRLLWSALAGSWCAPLPPSNTHTPTPWPALRTKHGRSPPPLHRGVYCQATTVKLYCGPLPHDA